MHSFELMRRGFQLGQVTPYFDAPADSLTNWHSGHAIRLPGIIADDLEKFATQLADTEALVKAVLDEQALDEVLDQAPYLQRLETQFSSLGSTFNEGDDQEIEMVLFDAIDPQDEIIAEDLWMKASWLSFHEQDPSLRFRFSFGVDLAEDVAADPHRQNLAAQLAECVFPESALITQNPKIIKLTQELLNHSTPQFVERIYYFNAPNGGAYLHHDLERGHAGVVYAQLSGATFWLALPLPALVQQIQHFAELNDWPASLSEAQREEIQNLCYSEAALKEALNSFQHDALIHLINETEAFVQHLHRQGYSKVLQAGDVILLPQASEQQCCWHSVFCLGEEMGEALSFAIR